MGLTQEEGSLRGRRLPGVASAHPKIGMLQLISKFLPPVSGWHETTRVEYLQDERAAVTQHPDINVLPPRRHELAAVGSQMRQSP